MPTCSAARDRRGVVTRKSRNFSSVSGLNFGGRRRADFLVVVFCVDMAQPLAGLTSRSAAECVPSEGDVVNVVDQAERVETFPTIGSEPDFSVLFSFFVF